MKEGPSNIQYEPIRNFEYAQWFKNVQYNGKTLSESERKECISVIDKTIEQYSSGLPMINDILESNKDRHDEYHEIDRTVTSIILFIILT